MRLSERPTGSGSGTVCGLGDISLGGRRVLHFPSTFASASPTACVARPADRNTHDSFRPSAFIGEQKKQKQITTGGNPDTTGWRSRLDNWTEGQRSYGDDERMTVSAVDQRLDPRVGKMTQT